jgi:hypothetical protein
VSEPQYCGSIPYFNQYLPHLLAWADFLIQTDEAEFAELLLTRGLPAFYRMNPPQEVLDLKKKLHQFMMTASDYIKNPKDVDLVDPIRAKLIVEQMLRGRLVHRSVMEYNNKGIIPHLHEAGPAEHWLPIGLKELGCKFTYTATYLSQAAHNKAAPYLEGFLVAAPPVGVPQIYVACEIIEHLKDEKEIVWMMNKANIDPVEVHLSTPLFTFGGGLPNWKDAEYVGQGGHLKTFTPTEFIHTAQSLFPQYGFTFYENPIMSLVGRKRDLSSQHY